MRLFKRRPQTARPTASYYCTDTDLYRVEYASDERALLEDCRTGTLIDVPLSYLTRLRPVEGGERRGSPAERVAA